MKPSIQLDPDPEIFPNMTSQQVTSLMRLSSRAKMATKKQGSHASFFPENDCFEGGRELFEACRNGDVSKVRRLVSGNANVNARDTAGRKSSPLHFAAGR